MIYLCVISLVLDLIFIGLGIFLWLRQNKFKALATTDISIDSLGDLRFDTTQPLTQENIYKIGEILEEHSNLYVKCFFSDGSQMHLGNSNKQIQFRDPFTD